MFGIQVGVAIGLFVRRKRKTGAEPERRAEIFYARTGEDWRKEQKYEFLDKAVDRAGITWERIEPDGRHTWLTAGLRQDFDKLMPLLGVGGSVFEMCSMGVKSNNDAYVYGFDRSQLCERVRRMVDAYTIESYRWQASGVVPSDIDKFLHIDEHVLKWIRKTKRFLVRGEKAMFVDRKIVIANYRPFVRCWFLLDRMFSEDLYGIPIIFPPTAENRCIAVSDKGARAPFNALAVDGIPEQHLCASTDAVQCFPFYIYDEDGSNRRDNITDWALAEFRKHYTNDEISKWDIFHYVYALLHHPEYRTRYEANLKRELPRIPYAPDFHGFARSGKRLAELHVAYEKQPEFPLSRIESPNMKLDFRIDRMKLTRDKQGIIYNEFLTLAGIPPQVFEYRLGNRSAIEWIIDQYQVSTDKRSGITSDPNRLDDPEYILRLIGQVVTVSVETVRIVKELPSLGIAI